MTSTDSPEALKPCHYCGAEWFPQASSIQRHSWGIIHKETCEISIAAHAKLDRTERAALSPPSPDRDAVIRECAAVLDKLDCSGNEDFSYGHDVALRKAEKAILALLDNTKPDAP